MLELFKNCFENQVCYLIKFEKILKRRPIWIDAKINVIVAAQFVRHSSLISSKRSLL